MANIVDVDLFSSGGLNYPQAERRKIFFSRKNEYSEYMSKEEIETIEQNCVKESMTLLQVEGNFLFDKAGHRDYLGAILNTGIVRDKVGDILVNGDKGCQIIVASDIASYVAESLKNVRTVPVKVSILEWEDLKVGPAKIKEMQTVEASLR